MSCRVRAFRLLLVVVVAGALAMPAATPASAYWVHRSVATAFAATGTLTPPTGVTATQPDPLAGTVHVEWATPGSSSLAPEGYFVTRRTALTTDHVCASSPSQLLTATSCDDTGAAPGVPATYTVTAVLHSWTAVSEPSAPVTVTQPLRVTAVTPGAGPLNGGTPITVTGGGFRSGSTVSLGRAVATDVVVVDQSTITAVTPAGKKGPVDVTVNAPDGARVTLVGGFTYVEPPRLQRITPTTSGPATGGTTVTITGRNFTPDATVAFGGSLAAQVRVLNPGTISAVTPAGVPGPVDVVVTTPGGADTLARAFTYVLDLHLVSVSPTAGPRAGGMPITLTGSGFVPGSTVALGRALASSVIVVDQSTITAVTPPGKEGPTDVTVVAPDGTRSTLPNGFTYLSQPKLHRITPASGPTTGGSLLTVTGQALTADTQASFCGIPAGDVRVLSESQLILTTPPGVAGTCDVVITTPGGTDAAMAGFTYLLVGSTPASAGSSTPPEPQGGPTARSEAPSPQEAPSPGSLAPSAAPAPEPSPAPAEPSNAVSPDPTSEASPEQSPEASAEQSPSPEQSPEPSPEQRLEASPESDSQPSAEPSAESQDPAEPASKEPTAESSKAPSHEPSPETSPESTADSSAG